MSTANINLTKAAALQIYVYSQHKLCYSLFAAIIKESMLKWAMFAAKNKETKYSA